MKTEATDCKCTLNAEKISASLAEAKLILGWARPMLRQLTHDKTINPAKIMNEFQGPLCTQLSKWQPSLCNMYKEIFSLSMHECLRCTSFLSRVFHQIVGFPTEFRSHIKNCGNATCELKLSKRRQSKREIITKKETCRSIKQNKSVESASVFLADFFTWSEYTVSSQTADTREKTGA